MYEEIELGELAGWIESGAALVDVREVWEFERAHLPGAVNMPMSTISDGSRRVPDNVVLVCNTGARSGHVAGYLALHGYSKVANLLGGTAGWVEAGNPIESGASGSDD